MLLACAADYIFLILTSAAACHLSLHPLYLLAGSEGLGSVSSALQWFPISASCCLRVIGAEGSHPVGLPVSSCHSFAHCSVPANSHAVALFPVVETEPWEEAFQVMGTVVEGVWHHLSSEGVGCPQHESTSTL